MFRSAQHQRIYRMFVHIIITTEEINGTPISPFPSGFYARCTMHPNLVITTCLVENGVWKLFTTKSVSRKLNGKSRYVTERLKRLITRRDMYGSLACVRYIWCVCAIHIIIRSKLEKNTDPHIGCLVCVVLKKIGVLLWKTWLIKKREK